MGQAFDSCWKFDGDTWKQLKECSLPTERIDCAGVRLSNGRAVLAGGCDGHPSGFHTSFLQNAIMFDPVLGHWFDLGNMRNRRHGCCAACDSQENIYVCGGTYINSPNRVAPREGFVEVFDRKTQKWENLPPVPEECRHFDGTWAFGDCAVLQIENEGETLVIFSADGKIMAFNIPRQKWLIRPLQQCPIKRNTINGIHWEDRGFLTPSGRNMMNRSFFGSFYNDPGPCKRTFLLEENTLQWKELAGLTIPRIGHACIIWEDCPYVLGGSTANQSNPFTDTVERYDDVNGLWHIVPDLKLGVKFHAFKALCLPRTRSLSATMMEE